MFVCVCHRIVREDQKHGSCKRPAHLVSFLHQNLSVEVPGLEDNCHVEEVIESFVVTVELPVLVRKCAKVGPVHGGEGSQLTPAKVQLLGANIPTSDEVREHFQTTTSYYGTKLIEF